MATSLVCPTGGLESEKNHIGWYGDFEIYRSLPELIRKAAEKHFPALLAIPSRTKVSRVVRKAILPELRAAAKKRKKKITCGVILAGLTARRIGVI